MDEVWTHIKDFFENHSMQSLRAFWRQNCWIKLIIPLLSWVRYSLHKYSINHEPIQEQDSFPENLSLFTSVIMKVSLNLLKHFRNSWMCSNLLSWRIITSLAWQVHTCNYTNYIAWLSLYNMIELCLAE